MRLRHALIPIALTALACGGGRSADTGEDEPRGGLFGGGGGNDDTQRGLRDGSVQRMLAEKASS